MSQGHAALCHVSTIVLHVQIHVVDSFSCASLGLGADPLRKLCLLLSHGGCWVSHDKQVL